MKERYCNEDCFALSFSGRQLFLNRLTRQKQILDEAKQITQILTGTCLATGNLKVGLNVVIGSRCIISDECFLAWKKNKIK